MMRAVAAAVDLLRGSGLIVSRRTVGSGKLSVIYPLSRILEKLALTSFVWSFIPIMLSCWSQGLTSVLEVSGIFAIDVNLSAEQDGRDSRAAVHVSTSQKKVDRGREYCIRC